MTQHVMYIIQPSTRKYKKYRALFKDGRPSVHFGDNRYQQYKDHTSLKLYSHLDHGDKQRRERYYQRHGRKARLYSAKYFSHKYLW